MSKTSDDYKPCVALSRTTERKCSILYDKYDTVDTAIEKIRNDRMAWLRPEDVDTVKKALGDNGKTG